MEIGKLRRHHLREWRKRLEQAPALLSRNEDGKKRTKERAKSTVNRDMVPLRAALGQVLKGGAPNTDAAWQEALRPFKGADKRRDLYLDKSERKRLIDAASDEARPFIKVLCLLPLRPGALAALKVADFDKRTRALTMGKDKNGNPRQISMPQVFADFFAALSELVPAAKQAKAGEALAEACRLGQLGARAMRATCERIRGGANEPGLPYFNQHCFRDTLVQLGERICTTPEQFKAWSQNMGHEGVLTTFTSYGKVPAARQAQLIRGLGQASSCSEAERIAAVVAEALRGFQRV